MVSTADSSFVVMCGGSEVTVSVDDETVFFRASALPGASSLALHLGGPAELDPEGLGLRQRLNRLVGGVPASVSALVRNRLEIKEQLRVEPTVGRLLPPFGEEAAFEDIKVGSWVVVWAVADGDNLVAKRVVIIEPVEYHHAVGDISGLDSEAITIGTDAGEAIVLSYDGETRAVLRGSISLEVGDRVRAVYDGENVARFVVMITD